MKKLVKDGTIAVLAIKYSLLKLCPTFVEKNKMSERSEVLKSVVHEKDGVTMYWNSVLERWDKDIVRLLEWRANEVLPHVQKKHEDLKVTMIDSPL